ncbi:MAG: CsgG/HfaB family protein, partial [Planctomycetota bacterium]
ICGCPSGKGYFRADYDFTRVDKVAVVDVIGDVRGESAKNQISDFFVMELLKKGFAPVERAQVQVLLKEQKFQATDVTTAEGAVQAGKILNVPAVLVVNIPNFGDEMSLTAKMVDVEDGSILWMGSGTGKTGRMLSAVAGAAVGAGTGAAVTGEDDKAVGAIVGGVLGGVAGHALSPQKAEQAQKVIEKVCKSLPSK